MKNPSIYNRSTCKQTAPDESMNRTIAAVGLAETLLADCGGRVNIAIALLRGVAGNRDVYGNEKD